MVKYKKKRIAFLDHSFHKKTKSSDFFFDILKERYKVDIYFDTFWKNKKIFDFDILNKKDYEVIVFWQINYSIKYLKKLKCKNIIYIPMYDDFILNTITPFYWKQFQNIKFISFSKTLHNYLINNGLNSFYIQYFPKPKNNYNKIDLDNLSAFFWYRTELINWKVIKKIITSNDFKKIYIQNHPDPEQKKLQVSKKDIKKYNIEFVEWFENKEEYLELLKSIDIYISPRKYEGIGLSFLEAMSYGKYIIALDNPTMNEYIVQNENGYLYNLENIKNFDTKMIDSTKIKEINIEYYKKYNFYLNNMVNFIESDIMKKTNINDKFYYLIDKVFKYPCKIKRKFMNLIFKKNNNG